MVTSPEKKSWRARAREKSGRNEQIHGPPVFFSLSSTVNLGRARFLSSASHEKDKERPVRAGECREREREKTRKGLREEEKGTERGAALEGGKKNTRQDNNGG
jgi:hypothetical protein